MVLIYVVKLENFKILLADVFLDQVFSMPKHNHSFTTLTPPTVRELISYVRNRVVVLLLFRRNDAIYLTDFSLEC